MTARDRHLPLSTADKASSDLQLLRRGACRWAAVRAASAGIVFGPTLDDRVAMLDRAREELIQLEQAEAAYNEQTARSLLEDAEKLLGPLPAPTCWRDAILTRLLVCLSARITLDRAAAEGGDPSALACEIEHVNAAHAALLELDELERGTINLSSAFVGPWLEVALQALDDEAARARYLTTLKCDFGLRLPN